MENLDIAWPLSYPRSESGSFEGARIHLQCLVWTERDVAYPMVLDNPLPYHLESAYSAVHKIIHIIYISLDLPRSRYSSFWTSRPTMSPQTSSPAWESPVKLSLLSPVVCDFSSAIFSPSTLPWAPGSCVTLLLGLRSIALCWTCLSLLFSLSHTCGPVPCDSLGPHIVALFPHLTSTGVLMNCRCVVPDFAVTHLSSACACLPLLSLCDAALSRICCGLVFLRFF